MSSLANARNLLVQKGFTGSLSHLDKAWDPTDFAAGTTTFGNPNANALDDDIVFGNSGANTLNGGKGNDILDGGAGADRLIGGEGTDWASYASATKGVTAGLSAPTWFNSGDAAGDTYSGIENLMGSGFDDSLFGNGGDNVISGLNGNDALDGGSGGNDTLNGDAGQDRLYAGTGTDTLNGGADHDFLYGEGGDTLNGDAGNDTFFYGARSDTMNGGAGDDTFYADYMPVGVNAGVWHVNGGAGNDTFNAGSGAEAFNGGSQDAGGFDTVDYSRAGSAVTVNLQTGVGEGGAAGDTYSGIEWVKGSNFNDELRGSGAQEVFNGGNGSDHFWGGGNNDAFIFDIGFHARPPVEGMTGGGLIKANIGNDVIHDYDIQETASDASFDAIYFTGITQDQFSQIIATQVGFDTVLTSNLFDGSITILNTDADFWHPI